MYSVESKGPVPIGTICPVRKKSVGPEGYVLFEMNLMHELRDYIGRVVIDWGSGARAWVQLADQRPKNVLEIRHSFREEAFPGFPDSRLNLEDIPFIPIGWQEALRSVGGVYVLTCRDSGELYVGSAYGQGGFLERFHSYAENNHGGNKLLLPRAKKSHYQVSTLEVLSPGTPVDTVIQRENVWKEKLGTRAHGLNAN